MKQYFIFRAHAIFFTLLFVLAFFFSESVWNNTHNVYASEKEQQENKIQGNDTAALKNQKTQDKASSDSLKTSVNDAKSKKSDKEINKKDTSKKAEQPTKTDRETKPAVAEKKSDVQGSGKDATEQTQSIDEQKKLVEEKAQKAKEEQAQKEEMAKRAEQEKLDAQKKKEAQAKEAEEKRKEAEEIAQNDPWKDIWAGQREGLDRVIKDAHSFSENLSSEAGVLNKIRPVEEDIRKLLVLANNFKRWPSPLEAVSRRLSISTDVVESVVATAAAGQLEARKQLDRLNRTVESIPQDLSSSKHDEIQDYINKLNKARFLLTAVITRYASALAPAKALIERTNATREEIDSQLPMLWKKYYMQKPVPWISSEEWEKVPRQLSYFNVGLKLRRPVELPVTSSQWQTSFIRFATTLILLTVLGILITSTLLKDSPEMRRHIQRWSMPWNVVGIALIAGSFSASFDAYRLILAVGNLSLIMGQIFLAWDLRRYKFPEVELKHSPLWPLVPLTMCAYVLLYLPIPKLLALLGWMACLVANLIVRHFRKPINIGPMQVESIILDIEPLILWPCLFICLFGLQIYSMVIYLLFTSLSIATQLSVGSMSFISHINENLPKEGTKSFLASLFIALSAPVILILALAAVSLWLGTLPGGLYILQYYIFKGVSIGETQLNFVQFLLIITAFFLARTTARMGRTFIGKLPEQGFKIERSLVTPMQTAATYLVWAFFGLFVLRSLGMNLSSLAVIAGGLSVGIGFGMQTIVNNFMSGLILIFSRALQVGDIVEVGNVIGRIRQITVRATVVETFDSATIYVPNSEFVSGRLTNWTSNSRSKREEVCVGVAYGSNAEEVVKLLLDIANKDDNVLAFPQPAVIFKDFAASTLDFKLLYWVKDIEVAVGTASRLRFAINKLFAEKHIEIAFPQMDVHVKELPPKSVKPHLSASVQKIPSRPAVFLHKRQSLKRKVNHVCTNS